VFTGLIGKPNLRFRWSITFFNKVSSRLTVLGLIFCGGFGGGFGLAAFARNASR
jgi:hypothetical protein